MEEQIDIYDANLSHVGQMDWKQAHHEAQWHRTFHCWIYRENPIRAVLFQQRAPDLENSPGVLDVSAAGHLEAGESLRDGVRELNEELGVEASYTDLVHLGERVEVKNDTNGQRNREYQSVFMLSSDRELSEYKPSTSEVWGLYWLPLEDGMKLMGGDIPHQEVVGITYRDDIGQFVPNHRLVTRSDFLPRIQKYYLAILIAAERLLDGKKYVAIS